jgi:hypothetical protein
MLLLRGPRAPSSSSSLAAECGCGVWGGVGAARSGSVGIWVYGHSGDGIGGEGGATGVEDELT